MMVRIDMPGAWHAAMAGTLIGTEQDGELSVVRYWGYGRVTAPTSLIVPVDDPWTRTR